MYKYKSLFNRFYARFNLNIKGKTKTCYHLPIFNTLASLEVTITESHFLINGPVCGGYGESFLCFSTVITCRRFVEANTVTSC